jgi:hypothetical protein
VYQITEEGLKVAYEWDFGSSSVDISKYKFPTNPIENNRISEKFYNQFTNGEFSFAQYCYEANNQNSRFFHTQIQFAEKGRVLGQMFYDKETEQYILFRKTTEGIVIKDPYIFNDSTMLCSIEPKDREMFRNVLSGANLEQLDNILEDDNPCLVKYTFKK